MILNKNMSDTSEIKKIEIVEPDFGSKLASLIIELERKRNLRRRYCRTFYSVKNES